jgi:hypothetical protein
MHLVAGTELELSVDEIALNWERRDEVDRGSERWSEGHDDVVRHDSQIGCLDDDADVVLGDPGDRQAVSDDLAETPSELLGEAEGAAVQAMGVLPADQVEEAALYGRDRRRRSLRSRAERGRSRRR